MSAPPATPAKTPHSTPRFGVRVALVALALAACAPLVRPAPFAGARDQVTDATLVGPFDGQVVDESTGEPVDRATVVGIWSYDRGDGFIGPYGSESYETETDAAGRYRIPPAELAIRGSTVRLVAFTLVIYKRGYVGYRSESTLEGEPRTDFTVRHNKIGLRKWRESDSHADHLDYLAAPRVIQRLASWEADLANLDLYRELGGDAPEAAKADKTAAIPDVKKAGGDGWLDASDLLSPDEIRQRTRTQTRFVVGELTDLERTSFYHGVHFKAKDKGEPHDIAVRVWQAPPGGMGPVIDTIETTMVGAEKGDEITELTWTLEAEGVYAVAFVDQAAQAGLILTCGDMECADLATALVLARELHRNLDRLGSAPVGSKMNVVDDDPASAPPATIDDDDEEDGT
ncbi:MAG: hypothetical protein KC486_35290 [Myxococcales bacterium]|nr:hypothetical protein [Myxococcales bacterium]